MRHKNETHNKYSKLWLTKIHTNAKIFHKNDPQKWDSKNDTQKWDSQNWFTIILRKSISQKWDSQKVPQKWAKTNWDSQN